jgi:hypothetical protein
MRKLHEVMTVGQALVVKGHGQPAFLAAHDAFLNGKDSVMEFDAGQEVSILFYTNSTFGLTIESIVLNGKEIEIKYRFGHTGPHSRSHLALISLPKLDSGRYDVKVVHLPYRQPVHKETARVYGIYRHTRVCKDCQFVVKDRKGI